MKLTFKHFFNFSFLLELFLYFFSLFLAIGVAIKLLAKVPASETIAKPDSFFAWEFVIAFMIATGILLLTLKYFKRPWLLRAFFYLAILEGILIFSQAYFTWPNSLVIMAVILFFWLVIQDIIMHDIIIVLAISSIAAVFGLNLIPNMVVIILILFAIYDFIAVYKTKHMVKMFQGMAAAKVHFALIIPQNYKDLFTKIKDVVPETTFMFLGTGDIALPAIFIVSCLHINLATSIFSALGAVMGFIFLYILFSLQKERHPMPGLPPIILGTLFGYLISFLF